jgi:ABC-type sugar transport system permease subunit
MSDLPGWVLPLALFLVPLLVALVVNRLFRGRRSVASIWVLAWFVTVCWVFALVVILRQVR